MPYRELFEHMPSCVVIYKAVDGGNDFILKDFNKAAGITEKPNRKTVTDKRVTQLFPDAAASGILKVFQKVWRTGQAEFLPELLCKDDQGTVSWQEHLVYKLPSGNIVSLYRDVTERKLMADKLRESEEKFRYLAEHSILGIYILQDAKIAYVNPSLASLFKYEPEEMIDQLNIKDLFHPDDQQIAMQRFQERLDGKAEKHNIIYKGVRKDGSIIYIQSYGLRINYLNRPAVIGTLIDITERIQADREKALLEHKLRQSHKMEAIGTLAGGIAHDFNNILSILFGFIDLAEMNIDAPGVLRKYLEEVRQGTHRAKDLVSQILTFSRMTGNEKQPQRLSQVVKESLKLLRASIPATVQITQRIESQNAVLADITQLHQIVMNLCTNAYHAMAETGGILTVSLCDVQILKNAPIANMRTPPGEYLRLEVKDTGHGMDQNILKRIFDPYFTTKETGDGTGLGLAVVQGIVKNHGGYIEVDSEPGDGSTFRLYLPVFKGAAPKTPTKLSKAPIQGGNERIMFVDDETKLSDITHEVLTKYGYQVTLFSNGAEAFNAFEKNSHQYDLIITDMAMPRMDGAALSMGIRRLRPHIPIILCSGYNKCIDKKMIRSLKVKYIQKPFFMSDLVKTVRNALDEVRG